jgi:hypothetical protein
VGGDLEGKDMKREAYRAGSFYEASEAGCRKSATELIESARLPDDLPAGVCGGLVPHAGWMFSGTTAALTLKALDRAGRLERVVLFGADHWGLAGSGAVHDRGSWQTPLGEVEVDEELAAALLESVDALSAQPSAHAREHSIEVQLPLMQVLNPNVRVVPIGISAQGGADEVGRAVGRVLNERFGEASVLGSTDLTHYGPQYGFTPGGTGRAGLEWAAENDRRILRLIEEMKAGQIVDEAARRQNACGGGAVAATIAAAESLGARRGVCLEYTTSAEVLQQTYATAAEDAVGYASVVFA